MALDPSIPLQVRVGDPLGGGLQSFQAAFGLVDAIRNRPAQRQLQQQQIERGALQNQALRQGLQPQVDQSKRAQALLKIFTGLREMPASDRSRALLDPQGQSMLQALGIDPANISLTNEGLDSGIFQANAAIQQGQQQEIKQNISRVIETTDASGNTVLNQVITNPITLESRLQQTETGQRRPVSKKIFTIAGEQFTEGPDGDFVKLSTLEEEAGAGGFLEARKEEIVRRERGRIQRVLLAPKFIEAAIEQKSKINDLLTTIEEARGMASGFLATGTPGRILSFIKETPAGDLNNLATNLKSNLALMSLDQLKRSSINGASGLGQLAIREFVALEDQITKLDPFGSKEVFARGLNKIAKTFKRYNEAIDKSILKAQKEIDIERSLLRLDPLYQFRQEQLGTQPSQEDIDAALKRLGL